MENWEDLDGCASDAAIERIEKRLDALGLTAPQASMLAELGSDTVLPRVLERKLKMLRGKKVLDRLASVLECDFEYLLGLEPGDIIPASLLEEEQGSLGVLAGDEEALLRAYRELEFSRKAALLLVARTMAGERPDDEEKPVDIRRPGPRKAPGGASKRETPPGLF